MKIFFIIMFTISFLSIQESCYSRQLNPLTTPIKLQGEILAADDISAITKIGSFLVIASDEAVNNTENYIQLLKKDSENTYSVFKNILIFEGNKEQGLEMDIEGLSTEDNFIYIIGSHSSKRKKVEISNKYKKNRNLFKHKMIKDEINRDWLYQLQIAEDGSVISKKQITLRKIIKNDPVLKTFSNIPSKENGVDIEGIAAKDGWLYIGFRGPVFRQNYVPIMKLKFNDPENSNQLMFVQLGGRGVRDMVSVSDGFIILAGPVGDQDISYQLFHWDGKDVISGKNRQQEHIGKLKLLGEILPPENGKAEGVVILQEQKNEYNIGIVYDGVSKNNIMQIFNKITVLK